LFEGKYNITARNILSHEWIGLHAKVVESTDASRIGIEGKVVDETRHTVVLETKRGEKVLPKAEVTLEMTLPHGEQVTVECKKTMYRPEDRIKALWRSKHG
jgi:ribonuclease P protein subunit POP4